MKVKIRHNKVMVINMVLYVAETITLGRHRAEKLKKEERKICRKILDQRKKVEDGSEGHGMNYTGT